MILATPLLIALGAATPANLPMPPPPPGMRLLSAPNLASARQSVPADAPDDPEVSKQVEAESAELEELRALEDAVLDPEARSRAEYLQSIGRLGISNPLRHRLEDAFGPSVLREDHLPTELRITDLASFDISQVQGAYDIPLEMQPLVAQYIRFFQGPGRKFFRRWMNRSTRYLPVMHQLLESKGLPRDTVYLAMIESGFSNQAYSWAHAAGPWQFVPRTGKAYGLEQDFWVDERRDPVKATVAAAEYLSELYQLLGDWYLSWAAYNAGDAKIRRLIRRKNTRDFWELSSGRGLAKETKHYVPKLLAAALVAKHPAAFGFADEEFDYEPPLEFDEVQLSDATDLEVIARAADVALQDVKDLNPELKRWCTPPATTREPYVLRLPKGTSARFAENYAKIPTHERLTFRVHRVVKGDTLSRIALAYRSAPEAIMRMNGLRSARALRLNADLVIPVPSRGGRGATTDTSLDRQVARARRGGFLAARPEEEVPAGTAKPTAAAGPIQTEQVDGKTKVLYGVQSGDSLWVIAQRFKVTTEDIRRWNNLGRRSRGLQAGVTLVLWPDEDGAAKTEGGTVIGQKTLTPQDGAKIHQLAAGETLWSVAQRYGVTVDDLKRWNNIQNHRAVRAGQDGPPASAYGATSIKAWPGGLGRGRLPAAPGQTHPTAGAGAPPTAGSMGRSRKLPWPTIPDIPIQSFPSQVPHHRQIRATILAAPTRSSLEEWMPWSSYRGWTLAIVASLSIGCGGKTDDWEELAHMAGDVMSSFDEVSEGGSIASLELPRLRQRDFLRPSWLDRALDAVLPSAHAAACSTVTFSACSAGSRTRTFGGCTIGTATLDGSVTLTFSQPACTFADENDTIARSANFTLTGPRGGTLTVTSPTDGQVLTRTSSGFTYSVSDLHRVATTARGAALFDITSATTADLVLTGDSRATRVLSSGTLTIEHNLAEFTTTLTPSNVAWSATCNCPVSGSLTGTLAGTRTGTATVTFTGCGTATVEGPEGTRNVQLDRCGSL